MSELKRQNKSIIESIKADHEGRDSDRDNYDRIISNIDSYLLSLNEPKDFRESSEDNAVRNYELSHGRLVASMEESGVINPNQLTVFEFETRLDYLQSKKKG